MHIRFMLNSFNNILPFLKVRSLRAISCGYVKSVRKNNNLRRSGWEDMPTHIMQGIWRKNPCKCIKYIKFKQTLYSNAVISILGYFMPSNSTKNIFVYSNIHFVFASFIDYSMRDCDSVNKLQSFRKKCDVEIQILT